MKMMGTCRASVIVALFLAAVFIGIFSTPVFAGDYEVEIYYFPDKGAGTGSLNATVMAFGKDNFVKTLKMGGLKITQVKLVKDSGSSESYKIDFEWTDPPGCSFSPKVTKNPDRSVTLSIDYGDSILYSIYNYKPYSICIHVPGRVDKTNGNPISDRSGAHFWPSNTPVMTLTYYPNP
jgi:hypothetical protein